MTDATIRQASDRKIYRRKKKWAGAQWTPPTANAATQDGLWCRDCMKHHGYKSMVISYNRSSAGWELLWSCSRTNRVLGTINLSKGKGSEDGQGID